MIKIKSIAKDGKVLLDDGKTGREATAAECSIYGYSHDGTSCYAYKTAPQLRHDKNTVIGKANIVTGDKNTVIGKGITAFTTGCTALGSEHIVKATAIKSTTIGHNGVASRYGEIVKSSSSTQGRTQKNVLMFEGRTVETTDATELYLGGVDGQRFTIDESYNRAVLGLDIHATMKQVNSTHAVCGYMHSNAVFQSTAGVLAINGSHTAAFASSGMSTSNIVVTAVSGTPDYIKVHVVGDRTLTMDWSVVINVYEIKTNAV